MRRVMQILVLVLASLFTLASAAYATEYLTRKKVDKEGIFNVVWENDKFAGTDRDYTNGIRFSWLSSEDHMPGWSRPITRLLPLANDGKKRFSVAAGQSMFAPDDITNPNPPAGQHPYAGWLYGSVGMVSDTGETLDNVMLTLGVVGPLSYAEQTQKFVHDLTDSEHPAGWHHQLKNEPGIVLTYERKWRNLFDISPLGMAADVTPHAGVNLGNINTDATVGATFRLGFDLPADYGPPRIRPSLPGSDFFIPTQELGGYLFTTVSERAVARNIFLDGNTFSDGPHVDKNIFVSSMQVGAAVTYGDMRVSYTQVFTSKEYKTQQDASTFGVITLSARF